MAKILVVDDSLFMRNSIKSILTNNGHTVIGEADNGRTGLEKYKELSPDIVTLDITMGDMTGLEALKEIMEYDANAKIVMVSAMGQELIIAETLEKGAKGFLVKPFKEEAVALTLSKLC